MNEHGLKLVHSIQLTVSGQIPERFQGLSEQICSNATPGKPAMTHTIPPPAILRYALTWDSRL